ncbi:Cation-transporting P-type ATPase [Carpediemonas membranifera]|uniref:Phospholipid-transporting ATPase n=1 Tax=Carpediemonas membranifera TaxID=201153 RepID=A0A8J6BYF6_9EUKA|nr:Cation-transporting P-type ATPase [Carpediemonas membranifera]|eukprot:KAG9394431.1 Cation-transporting P-type ATPase [Carpediemonas membranifera]
MALRKRKGATAEASRVIQANTPSNKAYAGNKVSTAQYSLLTSPLLLLSQFKKFSNLFFLFVAVINLIPGVSVFNPINILTPIVFILTVGVIRELLEDLGRKKSDMRANRAPVSVYREGRLTTARCSALRPGDVIVVREGEEVPADILVLASSDVDDVAYVQTANLDGETALKPRYALGPTAALPEALLGSWKGTVTVNGPTRNLDFIEGRVDTEPEPEPEAIAPMDEMKHTPTASPQDAKPVNMQTLHRLVIPTARKGSMQYLTPGPRVGAGMQTMTPQRVKHRPGLDMFSTSAVEDIESDAGSDILGLQPVDPSVSLDNLIPRGSKLANTTDAHGLVVYAGHETKMYLNVTKAHPKTSRLDRQVNIVILLCIVLFAALIIGSAVMSTGFSYYMQRADHWYLELPRETLLFALGKAMLSYFVLYAMIIPLSLFVSLEVTRFIQSSRLSRDPAMVDVPDGPVDRSDPRQRVISRTSALNEELGYVRHLFCDKTGTLTLNDMVLRRMMAGDAVYDVRDDGRLESPDTGLGVFIRDTRSALLALAMCNTVVPDNLAPSSPTSEADLSVYDDDSVDEDVIKTDEGEIFPTRRPHERQFQAISPDEGALVQAAHDNGVSLATRTKKSVLIDYYGQERKFSIVAVLEFTSDRKRMSVVLREDGRRGFLVVSKGADSVMLENIVDAPADVRRRIKDFSEAGLRTMVVGTRTIPSLIGAAWVKEWSRVNGIVGDPGKEAKLDALRREVESSLSFSSVVGIEDRLAVDVAVTLRRLLQANIKIWVLTGDKLETAVNIGYSAGLLEVEDDLHIVTGTDEQAILGTLEELTAVGPEPSAVMRTSPHMAKKYPGMTGARSHRALVISSEALDIALQHPETLYLASQSCAAVLCCRTAPMQKARVVKCVRSSKDKPVTAAIGDGANDVAMLRMAHVGIGIAGKEGLQASRTADYSIPSFRHVSRLMLVHGRWNYRRLVTMVIYCLYKNLAAALCALVFSFATAFSAQPLLLGNTIMLYNVLYTFLPPVVVGITFTDAPAKALELFPPAYSPHQLRSLLGPRAVFTWTVETAWTVAAILFVTAGSFAYGGVFSDGTVGGLGMFSLLVTTSLLLTVLIRVFLLCGVTWHLLWTSLLSLIAYVFCIQGMSFFNQSPQYFATTAVLWSPTGVCSIILAVSLALAPAVFVQAWGRHARAPTYVAVKEAFRRRAL